MAPFVLESSVKNEQLSSRTSQFTFNFKGIQENLKSYHLTYSIDDKVFEVDLDKDLSLTVKTINGSHSFKFFYKDSYTELKANGVEIKAQYHDTYSVKFESTLYPIIVDKPVIYLYPEKPTDIQLNLETVGDLSFTYPDY